MNEMKRTETDLAVAVLEMGRCDSVIVIAFSSPKFVFLQESSYPVSVEA